MPARSRPQPVGAPARDATFVFKGRVKTIRATTMPGVPVTPRTAVVTVEEILHAPEALSQYAGHDITVELSDRRRPAVGQEAMFYTNGWLFGKSVAVRAVDHRPVEASHRALLASAAGDPVANLERRELEAHFDEADAVVSGRVSSVHLPSTAGRTRARGVEAPMIRGEHDPMWREAVVEVGAVNKGSGGPRRVIVRFPASRDMMWVDIPKLSVGQEGYFMLHKLPAEAEAGRAPGRMRAAAAPARKAETYTLLHAEDFHPLDRAGAVQAVIQKRTGSLG